MPDPRTQDGTSVRWGNLVFTNVLTREFSQTVEFDPSDSAVMFSRIRVTIEGGFTDGVPGYAHSPVAWDPGCFANWDDQPVGAITGAAFNALTAPEKVRYIKQEMERSRQSFGYYVNNVALVEARTYEDQERGYSLGSLDINNGPKCRGFNIVSIAGGKTFRYTATFEVCILPCDIYISGEAYSISATEHDAPTMKKVVTFNRWSVSELRNADFSITRIINGRLRVATWEAWKQFEFVIKNTVVPPLLDGYQRRSVATVVSENQLDMMYQVVDQQREAAPPFPVVDWSGSLTETTGTDGEGHPATTGQLSLHMIGAPGTPKKYLFDAAMAIADSKLDLQVLQTLRTGTNYPTITGTQVTDLLATNELQVVIQYVRSFISGGWVQQWVDTLDVLPSVDVLLGDTTERNASDQDKYNRDTWPIPWNAEPSRPAGWLQKALTSLCPPTNPVWTAMSQQQSTFTDHQDANKQGQPQTSARQSGQEDFGSIGEREVAQGRGKPPEAEPPYTWIEIDSRYQIDNGWTAMPLARTDITEYSASLCRLHNPISTWTIYYRAKRTGKPPQIPSYRQVFKDENDIIFGMVESEILPQSPRQSADATSLVYSLECRYTYAMSRFFKKDEELAAGELPWLALENSEAAFKLEDSNQADMKLFRTDQDKNEEGGDGGGEEPGPQTPKPPPPGS